MPQREMWSARHPVGFDVSYRVDPADPEAWPHVEFTVRDQEGAPMEWVYCRVPYNVLHEAVTDMLRAAWEAYLFGELGSIKSALNTVLKAWKAESSRRPLWG